MSILLARLWASPELGSPVRPIPPPFLATKLHSPKTIPNRHGQGFADAAGSLFSYQGESKPQLAPARQTHHEPRKLPVKREVLASSLGEP